MSSNVTVFAATNFRNQKRKFGIKEDDRRRHMYVVGKTGMGKSTLLENLIIADIRAGKGVAVVDPHGDLAEKILNFIPNNRVNEVIYFNPSDTHYPIAFNILESVGEDYKHLVAYGLVGVFKKIWADSWGPRMEYIMTNTILALLDYQGSTLLGLMRMLVDKAYRKKVVEKVTDPVVKTFWANEYANYSEKFRTEAIAPIQNKVGQFLSSSIIRNIVGQSKSTIEMRDVMDKQKILIMNLAKGRIGEENSALLGAMMITKLQIAAMSRVDIPENDRKDFYLYVDEFQNFATDSFAGILSEARKYRLCLIMAHQYFEQLGDVVKAAVFGNVGTMIVFRVGATDAAELELEFAPQFLPTDIVNLKKYTFCMRLMVDGVATEPFSGIGLPPASGSTSNQEKVIKVSRERYARPQELVEDRIIRWSGVEVNRPNASGEASAASTDSSNDDVDMDQMEWPDPVGAESDTTDETTNATTTGEQFTASSEGVQLQADVKAPSAYVNAAGFIPGDHTTDMQAHVPAVSVAQMTPTPTEPIKPVVQLEQQPTSHHTEKVRPKISFINHAPSVTTALETAEPTIEVAVQSSPVQEAAPIEDDEEVDDDDVFEDEEPTVEVAAPVVPDRISEKPTAPVQPTVDAKPVTVSLQDLKTGQVTPVQFKTQSAGQSTSPQSSAAAGVVTLNDSTQKKKRRRKRKRNGLNGNGTGSNGGTSSPTTPGMPTQQSKPQPMLTVKPAVAQPQGSQTKITPSQSNVVNKLTQPQISSTPPATPKPAPQAGNATKISWGEVLD